MRVMCLLAERDHFRRPQEGWRCAPKGVFRRRLCCWRGDGSATANARSIQTQHPSLPTAALRDLAAFGTRRLPARYGTVRRGRTLYVVRRKFVGTPFGTGDTLLQQASARSLDARTFSEVAWPEPDRGAVAKHSRGIGSCDPKHPYREKNRLEIRSAGQRNGVGTDVRIFPAHARNFARFLAIAVCDVGGELVRRRA